MDRIIPPRRSENMRRIRSRDTQPEKLVRKLLSELGYRYRLNCRNLPGKPDLVFRPRKKAVFIHGCFWHQHKGCKECRIPKSNTNYWVPKLARNIERDYARAHLLRKLGWRVLILWECELRNMAQTRRRLRKFLGPVSRTKNRPSSG